MVFNIRLKMLSVALIPTLITTLCIGAISLFELMGNTDKHIASTAESLRSKAEDELTSYLDLAHTAIADLYNNPELDVASAQQLARVRLTRLRYGEAGYFFGYDSQGNRVFDGLTNAKIGDNFWDLKSADGVKILQEMIKKAQSGGGFLVYKWPKRGDPTPHPKLGKGIWLEKWGWMIGTGFYIDDIDRQVEQIATEADKNIRSSLTFIITICIILLVILTVVASSLSGSISRPLLDVANNLNEMASGRGDLRHRLPVKRADEIGQLSESFNQFISKIHQIVLGVQNTEDDLKIMVGDMHKHSSQVNENMMSHREEMQQMALEMNEVSNVAKTVSQNSERAVNSTQEADAVRAKTLQVVQQTIGSIEKFAAEVEQAAIAIKALESDVNDIASVLDVISSIAEQTNLLALNAAIEAARAGEQGRGFAVVADEVRTLASRTAESTKEIHTMIERLQAGSKRAVEVIQASHTYGDKTVTQASSAGSSLDQISLSIDNINQVNTEIAHSAADQMDAASRVNTMTTDIATAIFGSSEEMKKVAKIGDHLRKLADDLHDQVGQFQT